MILSEDRTILLSPEGSIQEDRSCIVPNTVTHIADNAFSHRLEFGEQAFEYCHNLAQITLHDGQIKFPDGLLQIGRAWPLKIARA